MQVSPLCLGAMMFGGWGNTDHAESVLTPMVDQLRPGTLRGIALNLLAAIRIYDNNFVTAIDLLTRAVDDAQDAAPILVQTLLNLSFTQGVGAFAEGTPAQGMFDESFRNAMKSNAWSSLTTPSSSESNEP